MKVNSKQKRHVALPILVLATVMIVLFFGLRPKNWPVTNNIDWLSSKKALCFQNPAIAYVDDVHLFANKDSSGDFTIQMGVSPKRLQKHGFRPILMMHGGVDSHQLTIWHWGASVIVMNGDDYDYSRKWPRITAPDALAPGESSFITVTASDLGTRLFINGVLVKEDKTWKLNIPDAGKKLRLILGNSVYGKHGWEGEIYGLALYAKAFTPERVKRQYDKWLRQKDFVFDSTDDLLLLYSFNDFEGHLVPDQTGRNQPLQLPLRPVVLKRTFLSSPYHNFNPNKFFFVDAILNLVGFIPLGAVIYCWLQKTQSLPKRYEVPVIVGFCFFLSLSIEIFQVWIPDRASSLLDLALNTLGAWLGILLVNLIQRAWRDKLQKSHKD